MVSNEQQLNSRWLIYYGLTYSLFQNLGKNTVYTYTDTHEVQDTLQYSGNGVYHTYSGMNEDSNSVFAECDLVLESKLQPYRAVSAAVIKFLFWSESF